MTRIKGKYITLLPEIAVLVKITKIIKNVDTFSCQFKNKNKQSIHICFVTYIRLPFCGINQLGCVNVSQSELSIVNNDWSSLIIMTGRVYR